jgi:sulfur relay (sulfurtransferase) complex TusBCD TusD component (DsrE family)
MPQRKVLKPTGRLSKGGVNDRGDNVNNYLLIESRDPFESNDVSYYYELSKGLVDAGNEVTLFLVQNGVLAARPSAHSAAVSALCQSGVKVLADDFSLSERGISKLAQGVVAAPIDVIVDHLAAGHKTLWH